MFTGIVQAVGTVVARERAGGGLRFRVAAPGFAADLAEGESVAVGGVCQTVVAVEGERFSFESVAATLSRTTLGDHGEGSAVNLERSLRPTDRIGGHLVHGHVDGVGVVREVERAEETVYLRVALPPEVDGLTAERGSLALDGVSLTVRSREGGVAEFAIVPYTWSHTTLNRLATGDRVNVEADPIARYVRRVLEAR